MYFKTLLGIRCTIRSVESGDQPEIAGLHEVEDLLAYLAGQELHDIELPETSQLFAHSDSSRSAGFGGYTFLLESSSACSSPSKSAIAVGEAVGMVKLVEDQDVDFVGNMEDR